MAAFFNRKRHLIILFCLEKPSILIVPVSSSFSLPSSLRSGILGTGGLVPLPIACDKETLSTAVPTMHLGRVDPLPVFDGRVLLRIGAQLLIWRNIYIAPETHLSAFHAICSCDEKSQISRHAFRRRRRPKRHLATTKRVKRRPTI